MEVRWEYSYSYCCFFICIPLQVFDLWNLTSDSYAQRAAVRAALAQDATWNSEYLSKASQMMMNQDNEVTYLVPWSNLKNAPQEGGKSCPVITQTHTHIQSKCAPDFHLFQVSMSWWPIRCIPAVQQFGVKPSRRPWPLVMHQGTGIYWAPFTAKLASLTEVHLKTLTLIKEQKDKYLPKKRDDCLCHLCVFVVHALWWYASADQRAELRHKSHTDARIVAAGETLTFVYCLLWKKKLIINSKQFFKKIVPFCIIMSVY